MVYCGKPSSGCHDCRLRKTRCDKIPLPQGCTQCAKAKRKCTGYRIQGELTFRDESSSVVRKFKAKETRKLDAKDSSTGPTSLLSNGGEDTNSTGSQEFLGIHIVKHYHTQHLLGITHLLTPNIEERAVGFFVANYVLSEHGPSHGHLDCIPDLYKTQRVGQCLDASMAAVGLANFSHATSTPVLMQNARRQYLKAIQLTNQALKSPEDVKADSTLMSIMVLGIFEAVTGSKHRSLKSWADHVQGAAAVINLRGIEGVRTLSGRRMLFQVASGLLTNCLYRGVSLPDFMCRLIDEATEIIEVPSPALLAQRTMVAYASLNARIIDGSCSEPRTIVAKALEIEKVLLDCFINPRPGWQYETVFTDTESDLIYNGRYHIYYDYWVAQIWNSMRIARILIHGTIRDALLKGFSSRLPLFSEPEYAIQLQISTNIQYQMQQDILSTVPQHLGFVSACSLPFQQNTTVEHSYSISQCKCSQSSEWFNDSQSLRISGGFFLIWPLWFAGILDITDESVRQFVIKNLKFVGHKMGIQQAFVLAATIECGTGMQAW